MKYFLLLSVFCSLTSLACDGGLVPHNTVQIPENSALANDITEKVFKDTIKAFEKFFAPEIDNSHNAELVVIGSWASNTVNAYAEQDDDTWIITIYGGLARHKNITQDGLKLALCHELGHHMGGYPKKSTNKWSSAEGQADYFATMKCLRRLWEKEDNQKAVEGMSVPLLVQSACAKTENPFLCQRMNMAGKSVALMFQDLDHDSIEPKFETPDTLVVRSINYMHPFSQCRLDTYFAGTLCPESSRTEFDNHDETIGSCHEIRGDKTGIRPRCWFVPSR